MSKAALALVGLAAGVGIILAVKNSEAEPPPAGDTGNDNIDTGDDVITENPDSPPVPSESEEQGSDDSPGLPTAGGNAGSGSGDTISTDPADPDFVPNIDVLTPEIISILTGPLANVDLRGITSLHFLGMGKPIQAPGQPDFMEWVGTQNIAGGAGRTMPVHVWVSFDNPKEWITAFMKEDPPGSIPPFHWIPFRVSETQNKDWMTFNILRRNP